MNDQDDDRFSYFNGVETVFGDALAMHTELLIATAGDPGTIHRKVFINITPQTSAKDILEAHTAEKQLVEIVRSIFKMKEFNPKDGSGATVNHCLKAWQMLAAFLSRQKKNTVRSPTSSPSTAGPQVSSTPIPSASA
jgi:hypothetical protein